MLSTKSEDAATPAATPTGEADLMKPVLSSREQEILMAAWLAIRGPEPQIDYERLAKLLGLKNAHTANTAFYNVKKKVKKFRSQSDEADVSQPSTPMAKVMPRKRAGGRDPATPKSGKVAKRVKSEPSTPKECQSPADDEQDNGI